LLDDAGDLDARVGAELAEDVADVGLHRSRAEEQLVRDLAIGATVDDAPRDVELALGERGDDPAAVGRGGLGPSVDAVAELAELAFGGVAIAHRAAP
jgi:hypothetical protein